MEYLSWLEQTSFSTWMRESPSVWAYPMVLFMHTLGLGLLVGASMVIDLRVLGCARDLPLEPMKKFFPVMWIGFWINALSGLALVTIDATAMLTNPLFYVKLVFIALAITCGRFIGKLAFSDALSDKGPLPPSKILAAASLVFWMAAITGGRLTAYLFKDVGMADLSH